MLDSPHYNNELLNLGKGATMKAFNANLPACVTNSANLQKLTPQNRKLSYRFLQALEDKLAQEAFKPNVSTKQFVQLVAKGSQVHAIKGML